MDKLLEREVRERAGGRCEYSQLPEVMSELRHVVDHIIARQHRGPTVSENLALACGRCNRHKGSNISGVDSHDRSVVRLFNPRVDSWGAHFRWDGPRILALTSVGRATVEALAMNHPYRVAARSTLIQTGRWRPD